MQMIRNLFLLLLLLAVSGCSFAGNSEAVSIETIEPGVQKVTPLVDRNTFLPNDNATAPWYRVYDDQTGKWYPARQSASGEWELTREGVAMRKDDLESLAKPDEDQILQWRNDTRGFSFSPELTNSNSANLGQNEAKPSPQLALERQRPSESSTDGAAADSTAQAPAEEAAPAVERVAYGAKDGSSTTQEVVVPVDASTLTLQGQGSTWATAVIDGGSQHDFFIRSGQTIDLHFGSSLVLEVGDALAVDASLDGEPYTLPSEGNTTIRKP